MNQKCHERELKAEFSVNANETFTFAKFQQMADEIQELRREIEFMKKHH